MHTTKSNNICFFHNGDYSGEVRIFDEITEYEVTVEFDALLEFVGDFVRSRRIQELENATATQIINIPD